MLLIQFGGQILPFVSVGIHRRHDAHGGMLGKCAEGDTGSPATADRGKVDLVIRAKDAGTDDLREGASGEGSLEKGAATCGRKRRADHGFRWLLYC